MDQVNWQRREAATLFNWETVGQEITGKLVNVDEVEIEDKTTKAKKFVTQFLIRSDSGKSTIKMLASADLIEKITVDDVGRRVKIRWTGNRDLKNGGNPMREFAVDVEA